MARAWGVNAAQLTDRGQGCRHEPHPCPLNFEDQVKVIVHLDFKLQWAGVPLMPALLPSVCQLLARTCQTVVKECMLC